MSHMQLTNGVIFSKENQPQEGRNYKALKKKKKGKKKEI